MRYGSASYQRLELAERPGPLERGRVGGGHAPSLALLADGLGGAQRLGLMHTLVVLAREGSLGLGVHLEPPPQPTVPCAPPPHRPHRHEPTAISPTAMSPHRHHHAHIKREGALAGRRQRRGGGWRTAEKGSGLPSGNLNSARVSKRSSRERPYSSSIAMVASTPVGPPLPSADDEAPPLSMGFMRASLRAATYARRTSCPRDQVEEAEKKKSREEVVIGHRRKNTGEPEFGVGRSECGGGALGAVVQRRARGVRAAAVWFGGSCLLPPRDPLAEVGGELGQQAALLVPAAVLPQPLGEGREARCAPGVGPGPHRHGRLNGFTAKGPRGWGFVGSGISRA